MFAIGEEMRQVNDNLASLDHSACSVVVAENATLNERLVTALRYGRAKVKAELPSADARPLNAYDLSELGLEHLEDDLMKCHLSPCAAFSSKTINLSGTEAILDSGASKHFITRALRSQLTNLKIQPVRMCAANGQHTTLPECGDFHIKLEDDAGFQVGTLPLNACSVLPPSSRHSLISFFQLVSEGAHFDISDPREMVMTYLGYSFPLRVQSNLIIIDLSSSLRGNRVADSGTSNNSHFPDDVLDNADHTACSAAAASMKVWHDRLGHADNKRIHFLNKTGTALGLKVKGKKEHHDGQCACDACLRVNNISRSVAGFREFNDEVSRKGELITSDVLGPFPPTPEGHCYAISFTDEFTRFSCVYLLKHKSGAAEALTALVEYYKSVNIIIGTIRTDQGGEYGGHNHRYGFSGGSTNLPPVDAAQFFDSKFQSVCRKHSIKSELTPAHRPELHGIAERWNRSVMQMANSMMYNARVSPVLWSSAVSHANLIRNKLPCRSRSGHTPYELFTNRRPRYDNFRVWGCYASRKLPNLAKIPGLPVRRRLIYVGETPDRIGFRCFDPIEYKFTTEYELIFDEESVARRSSLLEAFDNRRKLIKDGKIADVPIIPGVLDVDPTVFERDVFLPSPHNHERAAAPVADLIQYSEDSERGRVSCPTSEATVAEAASPVRGGHEGKSSTQSMKSLAISKDISSTSKVTTPKHSRKSVVFSDPITIPSTSSLNYGTKEQVNVTAPRSLLHGNDTRSKEKIRRSPRRHGLHSAETLTKVASIVQPINDRLRSGSTQDDDEGGSLLELHQSTCSPPIDSLPPTDTASVAIETCGLSADGDNRTVTSTSSHPSPSFHSSEKYLKNYSSVSNYDFGIRVDITASANGPLTDEYLSLALEACR
jgi:hypothetical protein